jgi:hypothetical protein
MKEPQNIELKSRFNDEVIESLVAFANTNRIFHPRISCKTACIQGAVFQAG